MAKEKTDFAAKIVRYGILTLCLGLVANYIPALFMWLNYGVMPPVGDILKIWMAAAVTYGVSWVVQPITFFGMLGMSGSYVSWIAGSVADIRCPAAAMAQKVTDCEQGTPEGDVMATIGIASSVLVSVSVVSFFTFVGANFIEYLPPFIKESFKVILPAVFGAVYVELASKHLKLGAVAIILGLLMTFGFKKLGIPAWCLNIAVILGTIFLARFQYLSERKK